MNVGTFYKCNKCGCKTNAGIKVGDYVLCSNCLAHKEPIIPNKNENQKAIECLEDVRDSILDISNGWWKCFKDGNQYMTSTDLQGCIEEIIDQKISELKGE